MEKDIQYFQQRLSGARVLLVEDEDISRAVVSEILKVVGIEVSVAVNGREAVEAVRSGSFDAVLMDVVMPEMNGYDATREIRSDPGLAKVPILAMTAYAGEDDRRHMADAGMNDHIAKPIEMNLLLAALDRWIRTAS